MAAASGWGFFIPTVAATVGWGLVYVGGYLLCVVAVLLGVRRNRPARPMAWYLLAAGYLGVAVAVAAWYPYVLWTGLRRRTRRPPTACSSRATRSCSPGSWSWSGAAAQAATELGCWTRPSWPAGWACWGGCS